MSVTEAPDGIRIGTTDGDRLPMREFDEYPFEHNLGTMTAGEVRTLNFGNVPTFRGGHTLKATLMNPASNNGSKLLIMHAWIDTGVSPSVIKVMVKNLDSSSVNFGNDQITVSGWTTAEPV